MLDLETFGNGKNACIVQIGACYFNRYTAEIGETLKLNVCAKSAVISGAEIDADTVYWWMSQDKLAQESVIATPREPIIPAMTRLNAFLYNADEIWSHATFDFVIIIETFKRLGIKPSFRYQAARDIRTLVDLGNVKTKSLPREGTHHDALDDCKFQVKYCVEAFNNLKQKEAT